MALSSRRMEWDGEVSNLEVHLYCNLSSSDFLFYTSRFSIRFYAKSPADLKNTHTKTGKPRLVQTPSPHFTDT